MTLDSFQLKPNSLYYGDCLEVMSGGPSEPSVCPVPVCWLRAHAFRWTRPTPWDVRCSRSVGAPILTQRDRGGNHGVVDGEADIKYGSGGSARSMTCGPLRLDRFPLWKFPKLCWASRSAPHSPNLDTGTTNGVKEGRNLEDVWTTRRDLRVELLPSYREIKEFVWAVMMSNTVWFRVGEATKVSIRILR